MKEVLSFFYMTTKVCSRSYSCSSFYSNLNGKENFESFETENDNGKVKSKYTVSKNGVTTTKYYNGNLNLKGGKKKMMKKLGKKKNDD